MREAKFERCGVFTYSYEPGTPAVKLDEHLPEEIKQERRARLMEVQQEIALAWSAAQVGKSLEVIVDGPDPEVPTQVQARGHADAPDIDCMVRVKGKGLLKAGDMVTVKITAADAYDLVGRAVGASGSKFVFFMVKSPETVLHPADRSW